MRRDTPSIPRRAALVVGLAVVGGALLWAGLSLWSTRTLDQARLELEAVIEQMAPASDSTPTSNGEGEVVRWLFEATATLSIDADEAQRLTEIVRRDPSAWTAEERELVTALARREADALAVFERAGALHEGPDSGLIDDQTLLESGVPLLRGSMLLLGRAGLALDEGPSDAGRTLSALAGIARTLQNGSGRNGRGTVRQIFGSALESHCLRGVRWMEEDPTVPATVLADLLDSLPTTPSSDRIRWMLASMAQAMSAGEPANSWWGRFDQASALTRFRRVTEVADTPGNLLALAEPAVSPRANGPRDGAAATDLADLTMPNLIDAALRMQGVEASRQLARVTLGLRIQAAVSEVPRLRLPWIGRRLQDIEPDPLAAGFPMVQPAEDGALLIVNPDAAEAWDARWGDRPGRMAPPPFTWRLPPEIF